MNSDNNQSSPMSDEPPSGSGPDNITPETPICPKKNVSCDYWTKDGCQVDVCLVDAEEK